MKTRDDITGVLLAGGKSSRMGSDKALLHIDELPLIAHVANSLLQVFTKVVVASDRSEIYSFLHLPTCPDIYKDCGPLGGIHAAFISTNADTLFVTTCDLPFITADDIRTIIAHRGKSPIAVAEQDDKIQPLFGIYDRSILPFLEETLDKRRFGVFDFARAAGMQLIVLPQADPRSTRSVLTNINTPDDYLASRNRTG